MNKLLVAMALAGLGQAAAAQAGSPGHGTIAIVASGPNAGLAVFKALEAAERVGGGSIGGFAHFYAMSGDGKIHFVNNFGRGGSRTLFIEGETTGTPPPPDLAGARLAGVISSGPRVPNASDPTAGRYPNAGDRVGFVVGHRIPMAPGRAGLPVNHQAFALLQQGGKPADIVRRIFEENPEVDAGLILAAANGAVAGANSRLLQSRSDLGYARGEDRITGAVVETMFNEIHPRLAVEQVVVDAALEAMAGFRKPDFEIEVRAGLEVKRGPEELVEIDDNGVVTRIATTHAGWLTGHQWAVVPYLGSRVLRDGATVGYTINEPLAELRDGLLVTVSTQRAMKLSVQRAPRTCTRDGFLTICRAPDQ